MKLTNQNVEDVFFKCLFKEGEDTSNAIIVKGVRMNIGFHPERLEESYYTITELLLQCHENFMENSKAKGYTFLAFCEDKNSEQWTSLHEVCDMLITMGIAIGKVEFIMPRDIWETLPGGMPYLQIKNKL